MILVTGASGFVGRAVVCRLAADDDWGGVVAAVRHSQTCLPPSVSVVNVGDITPTTDWASALKNVVAVVHCAARVHVMKDSAANPLDAYRFVNVDGTLNLARQAALAGVRRFVYISSIKVNGEATKPGRPFTADDRPAPIDPYGISKMEAEEGLRALARETGMEVVIVRPPLVYGPGVKANFASMMRWIARGVPLPLGRIQNARSMVSLDNLVNLLITCLKHPAAAGETFLVSDGADVSTTELLHRTARAMGKNARLIPVPAHLLERCARMVGRQEVARRLCGSLHVDIDKTCRILGWQPPLTLDQGLEKAVEGFKS
jgi:nucleoside-diphosphate-sugar epimerase